MWMWQNIEIGKPLCTEKMQMQMRMLEKWAPQRKWRKISYQAFERNGGMALSFILHFPHVFVVAEKAYFEQKNSSLQKWW